VATGTESSGSRFSVKTFCQKILLMLCGITSLR
jgi:hypothetical protein